MGPAEAQELDGKRVEVGGRGRVELVQRFGLNRTFQMQVQLGFRNFGDEIGHT